MHDASSLPNRRRFIGLSAAAIAMPAIVQAGRAATETIAGAAFGTSWRITGPAARGVAALRAPVLALFDQIDRQMSPWRSDSEISGFNRAGAGQHPVSPQTAAVARAALALAQDSGGRFDPSVGPLVARWGFGPIEGDGATGWQELEAGEAALAKARPGLTLDLCGIAKGFALDAVMDLAAQAGHEALLVDLGGELAGLGLHPDGRPWHVAVEAGPGAEGVAAILALTGQSVATSGTQAQGYAFGGRDYGHIIDPTTGAPVRGDLRAVSVVGADAMSADGWATALFAAGGQAGPDLARRRGIDALFVFAGPDGPRLEPVGQMRRFML